MDVEKHFNVEHATIIKNVLLIAVTLDYAVLLLLKQEHLAIVEKVFAIHKVIATAIQKHLAILNLNVGQSQMDVEEQLTAELVRLDLIALQVNA